MAQQNTAAAAPIVEIGKNFVASSGNRLAWFSRQVF